jgi:hypothetical protein
MSKAKTQIAGTETGEYLDITKCPNCGGVGNHELGGGWEAWGSEGPPGFVVERNADIIYTCPKVESNEETTQKTVTLPPDNPSPEAGILICAKHGPYTEESGQYEHPHNGDLLIICPKCRMDGSDRQHGLFSMGG